MKKAFIILALTCFVYSCLYYKKQSESPDPKLSPVEMDKTYEVKKGNFDISLRLNGNLAANKNHFVRTNFSGRYPLVIESFAKDKSLVQKDEVICQFEDAKYIESLENKILELNDSKETKTLALEDLEAQKLDNNANIKNVSIALRQSLDALLRYKDEDSRKEKSALIRKIRSAENDIEVAEKNVSTSKRNLDENQEEDKRPNFLAKVKADLSALETKVRLKESAIYNLKIFKQYTFPTKLESLEATVSSKKRQLSKAIFSAKSRITQLNIKFKNYDKKIAKIEADIKTLHDDMAKLKILAPTAGIITWGTPRRRYSSNQEELKVGSKMRPRNIIATIPDLSKFQVEAELPESYRSVVKQGLPVKLTNKALPDLRLSGQIKELSTVAVHVNAWDKRSPKVYSLIISTPDHDPRLKPGMSMFLDIIVEEIKDKVFVPVEAVYNRAGKTFCRVSKILGPEEREVETGKFSNDYVVIKKGLKTGDKVLLYRADK